jgi:hypothetical protein
MPALKVSRSATASHGAAGREWHQGPSVSPARAPRTCRFARVYGLRCLQHSPPLQETRAEALDLQRRVRQTLSEGGIVVPKSVNFGPQPAHLGVIAVSHRRAGSDIDPSPCPAKLLVGDPAHADDLHPIAGGRG